MIGFPWWVLAGCLALGACIASLVWFILWDGAKLRAEEFCQQCYDEGRDDERDFHEFGQTVMLDRFDSDSAEGGSRPAGLDQVRGPSLRTLAAHDWRAEMTEQLAPAVLDAENLPGPDLDRANARSRGIGGTTRAGELHLEAPLPAILHLGREYDGGDQTFARVAMRQMTAINAHEAARKALCEECGVKWVPMELIAA